MVKLWHLENVWFRSNIVEGNVSLKKTKSSIQPQSKKKPAAAELLPAPCKKDQALAASIHTSEIDDVISDGSISFPTSQIEFLTSTEESAKSKCNLETIGPTSSCGEPFLTTSNVLQSHVDLMGMEKGEKEVDIVDKMTSTLSSVQKKSANEILESVATAFLTSEDGMTSHEDDNGNLGQFWPHSWHRFEELEGLLQTMVTFLHATNDGQMDNQLIVNCGKLRWSIVSAKEEKQNVYCFCIASEPVEAILFAAYFAFLLSSVNVRRYLLDEPLTFHSKNYFVLGGIHTCLGISSDPIFRWISSNSFPLNLLFVRSHQAEVIIIDRLIQGHNYVKRLYQRFVPKEGYVKHFQKVRQRNLV